MLPFAHVGHPLHHFGDTSDQIADLLVWAETPQPHHRISASAVQSRLALNRTSVVATRWFPYHSLYQTLSLVLAVFY